jgi:hypothetical protein
MYVVASVEKREDEVSPPIINPKWFEGFLGRPWECAGVAAGLIMWPLTGRIEFGIVGAIAGIPVGALARGAVANIGNAVRKRRHAREVGSLRFTDDSKRILAFMLRHDQRTIRCHKDGDRVSELVAHEVLIEVPGSYACGKPVNMAIPNYLWKVLKRREADFAPYVGRVRILGTEFEPWVDDPE